MPRIIVMSETPSGRGGPVTLDASVVPSELQANSHSAALIERIGWALHDAHEAEADAEHRAASGETGNPGAGGGITHGDGSALADIAHAIREHEGATRRAVVPPSAADRHLYRRLRQALGRR